MKKYGLIGYPLSHSFSQRYFTDKFKNENIEGASYSAYPIEDLKDFPALLESHATLCGINVTIPHKVEIMQFLDWCSPEAKAVGAVNCIRIQNQSPISTVFSGEVAYEDDPFRLEGFNTDVYGFETSLKPLLTSAHTHAMILGDGGAAKAVKYVLQKLGIAYIVVARKQGDNRTLFENVTADMVANHKLIINTTPIGTTPRVDECPPIPYDGISQGHLLFDLIYNPEATLFLQMGIEQGAAIKNGYEMLVLQAEKSWEIWNSKALDQ